MTSSEPPTEFSMNQGFSSLAAELLHAFADTVPEPELKFYEAAIRANGGPALDQACGVGRHVIPLSRRRLNLHGADASSDALKRATARANENGVSPSFHHQRMEHMDLPLQFGTIFVPNGSFHVLAERAMALDVLRRFNHHLVPGGQLLMELDTAYRMDAYTQKRSVDNPWIGPAKPRVDGSGEIVAKVWVEDADRFEQTLIEKREYQLWSEGAIQRTELHTLNLRGYSKWEMHLMLEHAGFADVCWFADFAPHLRAHDDFKQLVCSARKTRTR
jgi:SAM-dependent methyltransferase